MPAAQPKPVPGRSAGRRRLDAAAGERIDHHRRAAGRRRHHGDAGRAPLAFDRDPRQQRQSLDQRRQGLHPRNPAIAQERVGGIVLAGKRAGMGGGKLARLLRAPELVGEHRLAGCRRLARKHAQPVGVAHRFEKQQVALDRGIVEHRHADLAKRQVGLVADRDSPAKPMPQALPRDKSVPIMPPLCEAAKMPPTGRSGSSKAAFAVSIMPLRRLTMPRLDGPTMRIPVDATISASRASRARPAGPASAKPSVSTVATATPARPHASIAAMTPSAGVTT